MILVGSGALLWRAARHGTAVGQPVDAVVHPAAETPPAWAGDLRCIGTTDVNELAPTFTTLTSDSLICSTGNPFIFRAPILDLGLTVVNIHGGPLPHFRGLPIPAAVYALLQSVETFGVTLHRVDAGIDTGAVIDRRMFAVDPDATLEDLAIQVTGLSHDIFVDNIEDLARAPEPTETPGVTENLTKGAYFGMRELADLATYRDHPNFERATFLGVLEDHYPDYVEIFEAARAGMPG